MKRLALLPALLALAAPFSAATDGAPPVELTIHAGQNGVPVAPTMHGLFFEDIMFDSKPAGTK